MTKRIAILHQGFVPEYRQRLYELLAAQDECRYVVFHGDPPPGTGIVAAREPFAFPHVRVRNVFLRLGRSFLVYQTVLRRVLFGGFDAVVLGHEVKFVANIAIAIVFRALGKPVLLWGFGFHHDLTTTGETIPNEARRRKLSWRLVASAKAAWARSATRYLAYAESGVARLAESGVPRERIHVLRNTIDISRQVALHEEYSGRSDAELRRRLGLPEDGPILVFFGRLVRAKRVDLLIDFTRRRTGRDLHPRTTIVVIGDGPERAPLEAAAAGVPGVRFWGHLHAEDARAAMILKVAVALVIPGYVGLAVAQAFAHGRPVITIQQASHSPEIEYVAHRVNGLVVEDDAAFDAALEGFIADAALQRQLAAGALRTRESLSLERMARTFHEAVCASLADMSRRPVASSPSAAG